MEHNSIDKSKLNLIIDVIMLLLMMPIAGIGFMMKYVLVPGFERNVLYGNNVDLEFWGQTRHQWGSIHLILSITFLVLLIWHIILHWKMIVCIFRKAVPTKAMRIVLVSLITVMGLLSISFPLFVKPEIVQKEPLHRNRYNNSLAPGVSLKNKSQIQKDSLSINGSPKTNLGDKRHLHTSKEEIEVYGSQTLQFVADKYNVPVSIIAADLKIPETLFEEKLGRIKKQHPFTMDDVKASISNYKRREK
ncbi:MAG: DUF4405 domain-containing protein [Paludibacter sp.]|nr:DUF4405 domain-containing protein [Paludibacter sp.]